MDNIRKTRAVKEESSLAILNNFKCPSKKKNDKFTQS